MIDKIQHNFEYYGELHGFINLTYRNDYGLTMALRTVNGHLENPQDFITGALIHAAPDLKVERVDDITYDVSSTVTNGNKKARTHQIRLTGFDFHVLNKQNFMELIENE
jgi:hypothetical protein